MGVRGSKTERTGGVGSSEVLVALQRLGWGVSATRAEHDLGTDLIVQARDGRMFEQGDFMGVQVKSGPSAFRWKGPRDGPRGWWFYDHQRDHLDAWVAHGLPHLLVLHDMESRTSYWVHVVADALVPTGRGAKIFVPAANTIDAEHLTALLEVAASPRPRVPMEGSLWTGAKSLPPRDRVRHALIVPRLIAPHPNRGHEQPIDPEQALALLVQARLQSLSAFARRHPGVPDLKQAADSPDWCWRFVAAMGRRLMTGEKTHLASLITDAPDPAWRVAAVIVSATGFIEEGRAADGVELLSEELERDEAEPVDYSWLLLQRARAYSELGEVERARADADSVQRVRISHPSDVTATAIAGVGASLLFMTADLIQPVRRAEDQGDVSDLGGFITGLDTAVSWWRAQIRSRGLLGLAEHRFKSWSRDTSRTIGGDGAARNELLASALSASSLGDHAAWQRDLGLLAQAALMDTGRHTDPDEVAGHLETLRRSGDDKALRLAIDRVVANGPAKAVTALAGTIDLENSSPASLATNLKVFRHGGDVAEQETADRAATWLIARLDQSDEYVLTLAALLRSTSEHVHDQVFTHLLTMTDVTDSSFGRAWARVARGLPDALWTKTQALEAGKRADRQSSELRRALQTKALTHDPRLRTTLISEAKGGLLSALAAFDDLRSIPETDATEIIAVLAQQLDDKIKNAENGIVAGYFHDASEILAILNLCHPGLADWGSLGRLIAHPLVTGDDKRGCLLALLGGAHILSDEAKDVLGPHVEKAATQPTSPLSGILSRGSAAGAASALVTLLRPATERDFETLLELLSGGDDDRRWAARLAGHLTGFTESTGVLASLANDDHHIVRATAAAQIASRAKRQQMSTVATAALERSMADRGTHVPLSIAITLEGPGGGPVAKLVHNRLERHPSAKVRTACLAIEIDL